MKPPADPSPDVRDPERVRAVRALGLLDTPPEEVFDRMTRLAATIIGVPASFISLVDADRDFYKSHTGMPEPLATERELRGRTFCHFTLRSGQPLALDDVAEMPVYQDVPTVSEDSMQRARDVIARQVTQLQRLVDDLMDATAIATGKIVLRRERVDLGPVVQNAVDSARGLADGRRQSLALSTPGSPVWIDADGARLHQVFSNLLTNAIKYTPPGGAIHVTLEDGSESVRVTVRDNGRGISADALPHIFDLFMQEGTDQHAGLGIGLNLVRGLVEFHGGTVDARSDGRDRGSEFIVSLPRGGASTV